MKKTKRYIVSAAALVCLVALCFSMTGCLSIGRTLYDLANDSRDQTSTQNYNNWFDDLVDGNDDEDGDPASPASANIKIDNAGDGIEYASAKGVMSIVSVVADFTVTSSFGGGFFGGRPTTQNQTAAGSGVIIKLDKEKGNALIMTNYHVVYEAGSDTDNGISDKIRVYLYGSESYLTDENDSMAIEATYIGGSMNYDLALLSVENSSIIKKSFVQAVNFADSDQIHVGQTAIAIGNPGAEGISVTKGIISKESETIVMSAVDNVSTLSIRVIRIDAAVNSGNSGGGLFDTSGNLIGIVNAKSIETNVDNIGYAIPSNVVRAIADNIIYYCSDGSNKQVMRALIGITIVPAYSYATYDESTGLVDIIEDVQVYSITSGSLSDGVLKEGDIVKSVTLNGKTIDITRTYHLVDLMLEARVGDSVIINIERNGTPMQFTMNLTEDCLTAVQ